MAWASEVVGTLRQEVQYAVEHPRDIYGIGAYAEEEWPGLNVLTGGLQKQWYEGLISRPGIGKSLMLAGWLPSFAKQAGALGLVERIVTLEMTKEAYLARAAANLSGLNPKRIRQGKISAEEHETYERALDYLHELPLELLAIQDIMSTAQALTPGASGVSLNKIIQFIGQRDTYHWAIDHIGLIDEVNGNDTGQVATSIMRVSRRLMAWTHDHVGGLIVTHKTRADQNKRTTTASIAGSDQIGRDLDRGMALLRPYKEWDKPLTDTENDYTTNHHGEPALLEIFKARDGETGQIWAWFDYERVKFTEMQVKPGEKPLLPGQSEKKKGK